MVIRDTDDDDAVMDAVCGNCGQVAEILIISFSDRKGGLTWCSDCAMQLARILLEDICALRSKGGRHGG